jgi:hypothetical protein
VLTSSGEIIGSAYRGAARATARHGGSTGTAAHLKCAGS